MARADAIVGGLFRDKYREILAALTREYGTTHLGIIEEAIQEAMIKALEGWSVGPVPNNPGGWLYVTARRGVIDRLRMLRRTTSRDVAWLEDPGQTEALRLEPLDNDVLKMIFICCHPALNWKAQLSLLLKNLCALGNSEIAAVLLSTPEAVKKTLTRAQARIRDLEIGFELPDDTSVHERLDAVLRGLYMMFNEGFLSQGSGHHTHQGLCEEAIKLSLLLAKSKGLSDPGKVWALAALLSLQGSHLPARTTPQGDLVRLAEQDRSMWDQSLIRQGMGYLEMSTHSKQQSAYHLQAAIAACHATAQTYEETNWRAILGYYDQLLDMTRSPIVALNRTVAIAMTDGYAPALSRLLQIEADNELRDYYLLPALKADYQRKLGDISGATANYQRALKLVDDGTSKHFLQDRLDECALDY